MALRIRKIFIRQWLNEIWNSIFRSWKKKVQALYSNFFFMRESAFVKRNKTRWEEFETVVKNQHQAPPDKLAELFIQITDDLSFSRTQYPTSRTTQYLNSLASKIHGEIYKRKKNCRQ